MKSWPKCIPLPIVLTKEFRNHITRFHDWTLLVTSRGRICLRRKKINLSKSLAGQAVGVKGVETGIWLVSFMDYDLGYIDLENLISRKR